MVSLGETEAALVNPVIVLVSEFMPMPDTIKGRYQLEQMLGQGSAGVVYQAYDTEAGRDVAVKVLRDMPDRAALEGYRKQGADLASLSQANLVEVIDTAELEEEGAVRACLVMPLLAGATLEGLIRARSKRLTVERSLDIIAQVCRGLQAAHERGLAHGNLKPSNIFVMVDGSVKLLDFGLRGLLNGHSQVDSESTALYVAPEQTDSQPASALSDLFSLGAVCYEMLTFQAPFNRPSLIENSGAILRQDGRPASELNPAVNPAVSQVIGRALAKRPSDRFATVREFSEALRSAQKNGSLPRAEPAPDPSAWLAELDRRVEAEPDLDKRIALLEEAIKQKGREKRLEVSLGLLRDKRDLVRSIVSAARRHEELGQLEEAVGQWEHLRTVYGQYPGLDTEIERLVRQGEQQFLSEAMAGLLPQDGRSLREEDYARMLEVLKEARAEMPDDADLAELERIAREGLERAGQARQKEGKDREELQRRSASPAAVAEAPPQAEPEAKPAQAKAKFPRPKVPRWIQAVGAAAVLVAAGLVLTPKFKTTPQPAPVVEIPVEVHTLPTGAIIRINNEVRGNSDLRLELAEGTYQLEAILEGYQPATTSVKAQPGDPVSVELTLQPLPQSLRLFADLDAGKIWLDDKPAGDLQDGQFLLDNVSPGPHTLRVAGRDGEATITFESRSAEAPVITGPPTTRDLKAILVANRGGQAHVEWSNGPAKVTVDGKPAGEMGPLGLNLKDLAYGDHELVLSEGKDKHQMVVDIAAGSTLAVYLKSDRNVGTMVVVTGEDSVRVWLDEKPYRRLTNRGQLRIANLDAREYRVKVAKEGFQTEPVQLAAVRKNEDTRVEFKLRTVPTVASLLIRDGVPGAQILLDRDLVGTIAANGVFSASNLSPGEHAIELRKELYKPRRIQRSFRAGETIELSGGEASLEWALGTLLLNVSPGDARVTLLRAGESQSRVITETTLNLPEGSYTLSARAVDHADRTVNLQVGAGETKTVDLQLQLLPENAAPKQARGGMADWENPKGWTQEGNWHIHRGGNFVLYRGTSTAGHFVFTASIRRGRRLQWVVNRNDDRNYALFQLDDKNFYRHQVANGKATELAKTPHGAAGKEYHSIQVEISPGSIVHKIQDGQKWVILDTWKQPGRNFTAGKFGFLIPGNDQVAMSNFSFIPQ